MSIIKKLVKAYNNIEEIVMVYALMLMVAVIFLQVVMRYVFNNSLSWSEELVRYLFIWQVWISSSIGVKNNDQIRIDILPNKLKSYKAKEVLELLCNFLIIFLYVMVLIYSYRHTMNTFNKGMISTAMQIPMYLVYMSLPFSSAIILIRLVCRVIYDITHFGHTKEKVEAAQAAALAEKQAAVEFAKGGEA